jgi:hypothetical protein
VISVARLFIRIGLTRNAIVSPSFCCFFAHLAAMLFFEGVEYCQLVGGNHSSRTVFPGRAMAPAFFVA